VSLHSMVSVIQFSPSQRYDGIFVKFAFANTGKGEGLTDVASVIEQSFFLAGGNIQGCITGGYLVCIYTWYVLNLSSTSSHRFKKSFRRKKKKLNR